ncbi:MAG TPA: hypothetical protein VMM84_14940 [Pyrinomonadaceae bacterium]|nr:hypothetical protein [Pyrinomonadaceae bacterium]
MNSQHWQQVKEIFQSAAALAPNKRAEFLAAACSGNDSLRQDVESLIAAHEKEGSFIDSPAYQVAAGLFLDDDVELRVGSVIGPYEIISMWGKGGMGKVYLAEDKRLRQRLLSSFCPPHSPLTWTVYAASSRTSMRMLRRPATSGWWN